MADTYIDLVNKLRRRFNEVDLTTSTWSTTIGFDQFTKDAINNAYQDILNAEMQWPFLHQSAVLKTIPGVQFYTPTLTAPTGFQSPAELKQIDYESFFISDNTTRTTISNELQTISSSSPYKATPTNIASWQTDLGVKYNSNNIALTPVTGDPNAGEYSIVPGNYYIFNLADAGKVVKISYITEAEATQANVITDQHLNYLDYDQWRQMFLATDTNALVTNQKMPQYVIKTNNLNEIGLSPVPDKIYYITYEYWLDAIDLSASTDVPLLPTHYYQIIIDGAQKYCYEFREDPQLAQMADARFKAGIQRMRIELINRRDDMKTGVYWYPHGFSYTLNTLR